jgi:predicted metalloprotease
VNWLVSFWGTEPTMICVYDGSSGVLPSNGCGPVDAENAQFCPIDGSISWDGRWLNMQAGVYGVFAASSVIGHEWGHLNDNILGLTSSTTFQGEQRADCQLGFASAAAESAGVLNDVDLAIGYSGMCRAGAGNGWFDPSSHGDCAQRQNAFNIGYQGGRQVLDQACGGKSLEAMRAVCG